MNVKLWISIVIGSSLLAACNSGGPSSANKANDVTVNPKQIQPAKFDWYLAGIPKQSCLTSFLSKASQ